MYKYPPKIKAAREKNGSKYQINVGTLVKL